MTTVKFQVFFWHFKSFDEMDGKVQLSSNMAKPLNGEGDLMAWLAKVKLVASLQKVPDFESFIWKETLWFYTSY